MIIAMDIREALDNPAGKGRYVAELMKYLPAQNPKDSFRFYVKVPPQREWPDNVTVVPISGKGPLWHKKVGNDINEYADHFLSALSYLTPQFVSKPVTLMVYDLIAFNKVAKPQKRAQLIEKATLKRAVAKAERIIAVSESTARDLAERYPEAQPKTDLAFPGVDSMFRDHPEAELRPLRDRLKLREFILSTGTIEPRKNLARLVKAYSFLPEALRERYPLLLVGKLGWDHQEVFDAIAETRMGSFVRHVGYVSDQDLAGLYSAATVFAYPSLYEGFGLPVVEAMASGTPVITSNVSSMPEAAGDAAVLVDPLQPKDIATALRTLLESPAEQDKLTTAGLAQAKKFTWDKTAEAVRRSIAGAS
jgi:glycosyltransferase involved in cell wall biosynthesis